MNRKVPQPIQLKRVNIETVKSVHCIFQCFIAQFGLFGRLSIQFSVEELVVAASLTTCFSLQNIKKSIEIFVVVIGLELLVDVFVP